MDWDSYETSWDFEISPLLSKEVMALSLTESWETWELYTTARIKRLKDLEVDNNRFFIAAYGLQNELDPEVSEDQITLARADREGDMKRLISYAIGCMMGRYSLDEPGLIYAHNGNDGFDIYKVPDFSCR